MALLSSAKKYSRDLAAWWGRSAMISISKKFMSTTLIWERTVSVWILKKGILKNMNCSRKTISCRPSSPGRGRRWWRCSCRGGGSCAQASVKPQTGQARRQSQCKTWNVRWRSLFFQKILTWDGCTSLSKNPRRSRWTSFWSTSSPSLCAWGSPAAI